MSSQTACRTIGHAISLAASGDSIMVAAATYRENLTIGISLNVIGSGASTTIIDGGGSGGHYTVVRFSSASAQVTLADVNIRNGLAWGGGGVYNNGGTLTIKSSTVSANRVYNNCYSLCASVGGGIVSGGTLTISDSTIMGNSVYRTCSYCNSAGGGIASGGTLRINNSTIIGNRAYVFCTRSCHALGGGLDTAGNVMIRLGTFYCRACRNEKGEHDSVLDAQRKCSRCGHRWDVPLYVGRIMHDFRRSAAHEMRKAGCSEEDCMQVTGHETRAMFKRCADLFSDAERQAIQHRVQEQRSRWRQEQLASMPVADTKPN
jgi:hypothetical protein